MRKPVILRLMLALALLCAAIPLSLSTAARPAQSGTQAAFNQLQARSNNALTVSWDARSGVPNFLTGLDPAARLPYQPTAAERNNPIAIARGFLDENRALFKLRSVAEDLQFLRDETDKQLGWSHVRMAQMYKGLPVFGYQLVVHLDTQHQVVAVNGHFYPDIDLDPTPKVTQAAAEQLALDDLLNSQLQPDQRSRVKATILRHKTQLMIYIDHNDQPRLTWYVTLMTDSPLGQWRYFVNARRAQIVHQFDSAADNKRRITYSADNSTDIPGRLLIDEGERSKDAIAQAAHDNAGKVYDYYFNTFQRDGIDDQGGAMVSTVHYGSDPEDAENAAWMGEAQQMVYGDGGKVFKPLPYGLDVVGHEFTHGIIDSTSGLIYEGQSGALNESYADVFGALIDRGNWTIGETVIKSPPYPLKYLRSLADPTGGGNYDVNDPLNSVGQPANMSEYADLPYTRKGDNGGVHVNSGIPNLVAYLIAQAIGPEKLEQIYYRALTQYLTPNSDFADAARATIRAAKDLYGNTEANAVNAALPQVGLSTEGSSQPPPPTSTPTSSGKKQPVPNEQVPAGCTNLIVNGTFEGDGGWISIVGKGEDNLIETELPHTGSRSAWLGGSDKEPVMYIYQDVRIPANATQVDLAYYRLIHEETSGLSGLFADDAQFSVLAANTKGDVIDTIEELTSSQGDDTWSQAQFDLSQLAGKTVRLAFHAENPKGNISSLFVDDVTLLACTTGSNGPSVPKTKSQDQVYLQGNVTNSDTKRGIEGAQVFILKEGLSATDAAADDTVTRNEVIATGVSDASGLYQTDVAIPRGKTYSVIVIAKGYRPIIADDGIDIPADATNPYQVDATMRKSK
ncbi:MAG TPA: M4 family metallopeptidase [Anaerolineae bacterium]|nr:M4 family metallopeptidase [Anaerolineae bacterium]